jgi:hypothetical protein
MDKSINIKLTTTKKGLLIEIQSERNDLELQEPKQEDK